MVTWWRQDSEFPRRRPRAFFTARWRPDRWRLKQQQEEWQKEKAELQEVRGELTLALKSLRSQILKQPTQQAVKPSRAKFPAVQPPLAPPKPELQWQVQANHGFAARDKSELSVSKAEFLQVVYEDDDPDWWVCENARGHRGVVPKLYVSPLVLISGPQ